MFLKRALTAVAIVLGTTAAANAADLVMPEVTVAEMAAPSFNWSGVYVGVYGGYNSAIPPGAAGILAGYNFATGNMVAGVEARVGAFFPGIAPIDFEGSINARAGFLAGDNVLLYAVAGIGYVPVATYLYWSAGGGAEVAVGDSVSMFGEARAENCFGCGGIPGLMLRGGVNWHVGN